MKILSQRGRKTSIICLSLLILSLVSLSQAAIDNCALQRENSSNDPYKGICEFCTSATHALKIDRTNPNNIITSCEANAKSDVNLDQWKTQGCIEYTQKLANGVTSTWECSKCECKKTLDISTTPPTCVSSTIAHCNKQKKPSTDVICDECRYGAAYGLPFEDYGLSSDNQSCINNNQDGKIPNCWRYLAGDIPKCEKCYGGWILNNDANATGANVCLKIPDAQASFGMSCLKASYVATGSTNLKCDVCVADPAYRQNKAGNECSNKAIPNCQTQTFSDECTACTDATFFLAPDQTECQKIQFCVGQTTYNVCPQCSNGYYVSSDSKSCLPTSLDSSCSNYQSGDSTCTCDSSQILVWNKKKCVNKSLGTDTVCVRLDPSGTGCGECAVGNILTISWDFKDWKCAARPATADEKHADANCMVAYPQLDSNPLSVTHCRMCNNPSGYTADKDDWGNDFTKSWDLYYKLGPDYRCYGRQNLGPGCPIWAIASNKECSYCNAGFYLNPDKRCVLLPNLVDQWCDQIDANNVCTACKSGYQLQATDKSCQLKTSTPIDKCSHYDDAGANCMHCVDGYILKKNQCIWEIENCQTYDQIASTSTNAVCLECLTCHGKALTSDKQSCVDTPSYGCQELDANGACTKCANQRLNGLTYDFYLQGGVCLPNAGRVPNCQTYDMSGTCTECHPGANRIPATGTITQCDRDIANCEWWEMNSDANNQFLCNKCAAGSTISNDQLSCTPNIPNCKVLKPGDSSQCIECNLQYYLKANYSQTDQSATECYKMTNSPTLTADTCMAVDQNDKCIQCIPGRTRNNDQASSTTTDCVIIPNCQVHIDTEQNACRECNTNFILKGYDLTNSDVTKNFGSTCDPANQFDANIQDKNKVGKNYNNGCIAYLANGNCNSCADDYALVTTKSPPTCEQDQVPQNCQVYQNDGATLRCVECQANYAVQGWDPVKLSGATCVASTGNGNVGPNCQVTDAAQTSPKCLVCQTGFFLKSDSTCTQLPFSGCEETQKLMTDKCQVCQNTHVLRLETGQNYGQCISISAIDTAVTAVTANGLTNIDKDVYNKVPNCAQFDASFKCKRCVPNFKIDNLSNAKPKCIAATPITNCDVPDAVGLTCLTCQPGFKPNTTDQTTCVAAIANCKTHNQGFTKCMECISGFYLVNYSTTTGQGDSCSNSPAKTNCFGVDASSVCVKCNSGFKATGGNCNADDCLQYNFDETKCTLCQNSKVVLKNTDSCGTQPTPAIPGCAIYVDGTAGAKCLTALSTYTLPGPGTTAGGYQTLAQIQNCVTHNANQDAGCQVCANNYKIFGTSCLIQTDAAQITSILNTYVTDLRPLDCTGYDRTSGKCVRCANGQKPTSDPQPTCGAGPIINCQTYNADFSSCWKCMNNFILTGFANDVGTACADNTGNTKISDCWAKDGSTPAKCLKCSPGFTIHTDGTCTNNSNLNCQTFEPTQTSRCNSCKDPNTQFLKSDDSLQSNFGTCNLRNQADVNVDSKYSPFVPNCYAYGGVNFNFKCARCNIGFSLKTDTNQCIDLSALNPPITTQNCIEHLTACTQCSIGYTLSGTTCNENAAVSNPPLNLLANCADYGADNKCQSCIQPYVSNAAAGSQVTKCIYTNLTQCTKQADAANTDTTCDICVTGYLKSGTPAVCTKCSDDKQRFENNACSTTIDKIPNCTDSDDDYRTCKTCATGFLPIWSRTQCVQKAIANCDYLTEDGNLCAQCQATFVLSSLQNKGKDGAQVGEKCHSIVKNCVTYDAEGNCTKCQLKGSYLVDTTTTPVKKQCRESQIPFCVDNQIDDLTNCPNCCNQCYSGFGLFAWTESGQTKHACVYNNLTCAQPNCLVYSSFQDWHASQCTTIDNPPNPNPSSSTSGSTTGSISISIKPKDTVSSTIFSTLASMVLLALIQFIAF